MRGINKYFIVINSFSLQIEINIFNEGRYLSEEVIYSKHFDTNLFFMIELS